jgi:hypothetical protein
LFIDFCRPPLMRKNEQHSLPLGGECRGGGVKRPKAENRAKEPGTMANADK